MCTPRGRRLLRVMLQTRFLYAIPLRIVCVATVFAFVAVLTIIICFFVTIVAVVTLKKKRRKMCRSPPHCDTILLDPSNSMHVSSYNIFFFFLHSEQKMEPSLLPQSAVSLLR